MGEEVAEGKVAEGEVAEEVLLPPAFDCGFFFIKSPTPLIRLLTPSAVDAIHGGGFSTFFVKKDGAFGGDFLPFPFFILFWGIGFSSADLFFSNILILSLMLLMI